MKTFKTLIGVLGLGGALLLAGSVLAPEARADDWPAPAGPAASAEADWVRQPAPAGDTAARSDWAADPAPARDRGAATTGGMHKALPWILAGVLVLLLVIVVVVIVVFMMSHLRKIREDSQREKTRARNEALSLQRELERKEEEVNAMQQQLHNQPVDDAGMDGEHDHTMIDDASPVLGVLLVDTKTGKTWSLNVHVADASGHIIRTPKYVIGKDGNCDVTVPEDLVSRQHCNISADYEGNVYIYDLDSTNGTFIQRGEQLNKVIGKEPIVSDDILFLGSKMALKASRLKVVIMKFDVSQAN